MTDCLLIAVDGPAGSGKSSAARGVARVLGLRYLDTGAMYRALTWWLLAHRIPTGDPAAVAEHAGRPALEVGTDPAAPSIAVDGVDVAGPIRAREVSNAVSAVASVPQVRKHLIAMQQDIIARACAAGPGIVVEGRDIGAVVAPHARPKVFLTASEQVRARRRGAELAGDEAASLPRTQYELNRRDRIDAPQSAMAADAVQIDSTSLSLDEVIAAIIALVDQVALRPGGEPGDSGSAAPSTRSQPMGAAWTS